MTEEEREFAIAELLAEKEEQEKFEQFMDSIPSISARKNTMESHLPLLSNINNEQK